MMREQSLRIDVDESPLPGEKPRTYVERIVRMKADAGERIMLDRKLPKRPVLTADTTVTFKDEILGKPTDFADAKRILTTLSGQTHEVLTAVSVTYGGETEFALSVSEVTFAELSPADIKRYIETGECMDKAGGYGIQGHAAKWISKISGTYSGVMGLPLHETAMLLRKAGLAI
jgi:septum formation protein